MNVDELLNYEAVKPLDDRLKRHGPSTSGQEPSKKKLKESVLDQLSEKDKLEVLKALENEPEEELFNESSMRKLMNQLEKRINKNQEMRIKFPDSPEKFMDSELELNDTIQEMHVISTRPEYYSILIDSNCLNLILGLLNHENIDISTAVISLLQELTDIESSDEHIDNFKQLITALCDQQIISLLIYNLERLNENNKDEADGVHNILGIVENIIEMIQELKIESSKTELIKWLLKRIKIKGSFDSNKLYAAEILSILMQNSDENRKILGDLDGIDILLQQIAYYKKHKPGSADEYEYMENVFDCLCSCLMLAYNRDLFLKAEGLHLMRLILREQVSARNSALKVLSYAMNMNDSKDSCEAFVEMLGLGILFPLFMKPIASKKKNKKNNLNNEEHIVSIVASLLKNCSTSNRQRVIAKFVENDFEKADRLIELFLKYLEQVEKIDQEIKKEIKELEENDEEIDDEREEDFYIKRLENGLFTLQLIAYIMSDISTNGESTGIKTRIFKLLHMRRVGKEKVIEILNEYAENLGDETNKESDENLRTERQRIAQMIEKL